MRTKLKLPEYIIGLFLLIGLFMPAAAKAQYDDVSLETFYDELSPYGVWINDPQYGYVWRPDVDQDEFRPYYSNGHWEMTRYGNTWVSDYDWGWAPFHYGRWHHSSRRGWIWVPDTQWGPAWVSWRSGGGYYGWAPLGPGLNININLGPRIPDYYWVFVPQRSIYYSRYPRYDSRRNMDIYQNTVIINNTYVYNRNRYYTGPGADEIRRVTRQPVTMYDVRDQRPGYSGNNRNNRPQVIRTPERSGSPVQNPRPQRPTDNSGGRGSVSGRSENILVEKPAGQNAVRPGTRQIPASSQRSERTYDNQDSRGSQSNQGQRQPITEGREQPARQAPAPREQRPQRSEPAARPDQAPAREQRPAPQVSRPAQSSRPQSSEDSRSAPANSGQERSSRSQGRPSRVQ